jgi:hypothetical protein
MTNFLSLRLSKTAKPVFSYLCLTQTFLQTEVRFTSVGVQDANKLLVLVSVSSAENRLSPGTLETKLDGNLYSGLSIHYSKCDTYHKLVSCFRTNAPFHVKIGHIQMFQELTARGLSKADVNFYESRLSYSEKVNKHACRILSFFLEKHPP